MTSTVSEPNSGDLEEVRSALNSATELENSEPNSRQSSNEEPVPGLKLLTGIMKATFFTDLFVYHAHAQFLHPTPQERVRALRETHETFYKWCRNSDMVARAVIMGVVVGLTTMFGVGTIMRLFF